DGMEFIRVGVGAGDRHTPRTCHTVNDLMHEFLRFLDVLRTEFRAFEKSLDSMMIEVTQALTCPNRSETFYQRESMNRRLDSDSRSSRRDST
ncbi:hypothetical protein PENTCL1PPCAC_15778, partial [Pristionchus entomophagus]